MTTEDFYKQYPVGIVCTEWDGKRSQAIFMINPKPEDVVGTFNYEVWGTGINSVGIYRTGSWGIGSSVGCRVATRDEIKQLFEVITKHNEEISIFETANVEDVFETDDPSVDVIYVGKDDTCYNRFIMVSWKLNTTVLVTVNSRGKVVDQDGQPIAARLKVVGKKKRQ